jgi:hypothetical protein
MKNEEPPGGAGFSFVNLPSSIANYFGIPAVDSGF